MKLFYVKVVYLFALLLTMIALPACEKEGAFEQAGERVDETLDDAADQVEEVQEDLQRNN